MAPDSRTAIAWVLVSALLLGLVHAAALPQSADAQILQRLREKVEETIEETVDRAEDLFRDAIRCVFDDDACIEQAKQQGKQVVLTDAAGNVLSDAVVQPVGNLRVEKQRFGQAPQGRRDLHHSPDGSRIAWITMVGSRYAAVIDGEVGPEFDGIANMGSPMRSTQTEYFVFSADGSRVAYTGRRGNEYVLIVDSEPRATLPRAPGNVRFSDNGARFVYVAMTDNVQGRLVIDGQPTDHHAANHVRVSPTGRFVLFDGSEGEGGQRQRFVLDNGSVINRSALPFATHHETEWAAFSADDRHFAFIEILDARQAIARVVHNGVPGKTYAGIGGRGIGSVHLSSDGERVAYVARTEPGSARTARHVLVLDGQERELTDWVAGGTARHPRTTLFVSPDGRRYAYERSPARGRGQYVVDGRPAPEFEVVSNFVFSPDSRRFAYTARQGGQRGKHFVVVDGKESGPYDEIGTEPFFSSDGRRYAYEADGRVVVDGNAAGTFTRPTNLTFSADGSRFAFFFWEDTRDRGLFVDGRTTSLGRVTTRAIVFSPDGRRLAYLISRYTGRHLIQLVVDGQAHRELLLPSGGAREPQPFFSPDGSHVFQVGRDPESGDVVVVINGTVAPGSLRVTSHSAGLEHAFLPDGLFQYFGWEGDDLYRYRVTPG